MMPSMDLQKASMRNNGAAVMCIGLEEERGGEGMRRGSRRYSSGPLLIKYTSVFDP